MIFNSIDFAIFLPIVFILYWFVFNKNIKSQNILIILASYFFYGFWDWRFLSLIFLSTIVDYFVGIKLSQNKNYFKRNFWLSISIFVNIGALCIFKYYNFFLDNFIELFSFFGANIKYNSINIIVPVGISFYTFQTLSYTIDIYRNKISHKRDFIAFMAFVSFFPQLVAGPIERAKNLLPQFHKRRKFIYSNTVDGMRQILWGLFKKIVIADNCAEFANQIFNNYEDLNGSTLILGAIFFAFQIYCDFSGYSDIAIGTARLFSFNLMQNFAFPFFSRDIAEFWRRWHISLSTWFRDYLYIPLGGSKVKRILRIRNIFIIFIVSGFWHGANWTYIIWGALHALYYIPLMLLKKNRKNLTVIAENKIVPSIKDFCLIISTFTLTTFAWIFFRSESITHALGYINNIFSLSIFSLPSQFGGWRAIITLLVITFLILVEWMQREKQHALDLSSFNLNRFIRWTIYLIIIFIIINFGGRQQEFIYFQF